jgi:hypothetical protein
METLHVLYMNERRGGRRALAQSWVGWFGHMGQKEKFGPKKIEGREGKIMPLWADSRGLLRPVSPDGLLPLFFFV